MRLGWPVISAQIGTQIVTTLAHAGVVSQHVTSYSCLFQIDPCNCFRAVYIYLPMVYSVSHPPSCLFSYYCPGAVVRTSLCSSLIAVPWSFYCSRATCSPRFSCHSEGFGPWTAVLPAYLAQDPSIDCVFSAWVVDRARARERIELCVSYLSMNHARTEKGSGLA